MSSGQTKAVIVTSVLMLTLLFECFHPTGVFYSYFNPTIEAPSTKKRKPIIPPTPTFPIGLAPQKVAESEIEYATCDTYQRKVFSNGTNFFVIFLPDYSGISKGAKYCSSSDGESWSSPSKYSPSNVSSRILGCQPDTAFRPNSLTTLDMGFVDKSDFASYRVVTIVGNTLDVSDGWDNSAGGAVGISLCQNLDTGHYISYFRSGKIYVMEGSNYKSKNKDFDGYSATDGGTQLLSYQSSSPYNMTLLIKKGDNTLHYVIVQPNLGSAPIIGAFVDMNITLSSGFESFCACSEVQEEEDPEIVHLIYIKSSGELCYRSYESDSWSDETVLVEAGASYPVITAGENGRLYVFYVSQEKIWLLHYTGSEWLDPILYFGSEHTYVNPAYLSTNQNVQGGKVCLVWTEGVAPYEVWFSYIDDA